MAELTTLARPYARAAFEYAREDRTLDEWSSSLVMLSAVVQNSKVSTLLDSPKLTDDQKTSILADLCGDELSKKVQSFVSILSDNKRLSLMKYISEHFENLKAQQEKLSDVQVISAFEIDSDIQAALIKKLKVLLMADVELKTEIDKSLIGGIVVRSGDTIIDGSVKGRLNKLADIFGL